MKKKTLLGGVVLCSSLFFSNQMAEPSQAVPINLNYEFSSFTATFNEVSQSTGNFQVRIETDTNNPNLGPGFGDFSNFYAASVFLPHLT